MNRRGPSPSSNQTAGFTLIELITVIVLIGILATVVTPILSSQFNAYTDSSRRATLVQEAQSILQSLEQDLARAVPNSIDEVTERSLSLLLLSQARADEPSTAIAAGRSADSFNAGVAGSAIEVFGCIPTTAEQHVVVFPPSARSALAAYNDEDQPDQGPVSRRISIWGGSVTGDCDDGTFTIDLGTDHTFDPGGDGSLFSRLYLASGKVEYVCDPDRALMTRDQDFTPMGLRTVSASIEECRFDFIPGTTFAPPSLLVDITLERDNERVRLARVFQLVNAP